MIDQDAQWTAERQRLQDLLVKTALELAQHTRTEAYCFRIPKTTPPVYVAVGDAAQIGRLVGK